MYIGVPHLAGVNFQVSEAAFQHKCCSLFFFSVGLTRVYWSQVRPQLEKCLLHLCHPLTQMYRLRQIQVLPLCFSYIILHNPFYCSLKYLISNILCAHFIRQHLLFICSLDAVLTSSGNSLCVSPVVFVIRQVPFISCTAWGPSDIFLLVCLSFFLFEFFSDFQVASVFWLHIQRVFLLLFSLWL